MPDNDQTVVDEPVVTDDLVFTTTKKDRTSSGVSEQLHVEIDGEVLTAVRPTDDAFALLTVAGARSTPMPDRMRAIIDFLDDAFDEPSRVRLRDRLLDRGDDFGFEDLLPIMVEIVKRWQAERAPRPARARRAR